MSTHKHHFRSIGPDDVMPDDQWFLKTERAFTPEQLVEERAASVERAAEDGDDLSAHGSYTCDTCDSRPRCVLTFDRYNTNGDCLAEK